MRTTANDPSRNDFLLDFAFDSEEELETSIFEPKDAQAEARRLHLRAQARLTAEAHAMLGIAPGSERVISEVLEVGDADVVELDVHALLTQPARSFLDGLAPEARAVLLAVAAPAKAWPDAPRVLGAVATPRPRD